MALDTFLFDLDGTLVDSAADLATSVNVLRGELGLPPLDLATVRRHVGDGARMLVTRSLPEFSEARLRRFLEIYGEHLVEKTTVYCGIRDFLDRHRHHRLAVVTNKPYAFSIEVLSRLDLLPYFPVVLGAESCAEKKPHPAPVLEALARLESRPERAVMIGDHHTDLRAGRAAGTRTCFCAWGIGCDDGVPCDFLAATPADLLRLFDAEGR